MLTTVCGLGVLYFALIPLIMEFGMLLALGVFYAWLCSILVLPRRSSSGTASRTNTQRPIIFRGPDRNRSIQTFSPQHRRQ